MGPNGKKNQNEGVLPGRSGSRELAIQLPLWTEKVRGLPNSFARSALFCVGSRSRRRHLKNEEIAALNDTVIRYTGTELRQDDEDVFLQLVHLARGRPVIDTVEFSAYGMLKELSWGHSSKAYERLRECIDRLKANALKVSFKVDGREIGFAGSLIRKFVWADGEGARQHWKVWFEREVVVLFGAVSYTEIEWLQRTKLGGAIAKWLHGFYVTLSECPPMQVETLRHLCGSQCASMPAFRQMLRKAMQELIAIEFIYDWKLDREYLYVTRDAGQPINRVRPGRALGVTDADLAQEELVMG